MGSVGIWPGVIGVVQMVYGLARISLGVMDVTDNGGVFINHQLQEYCRDHGISLITSITYIPELNGWAEI